MQQEIVAILPEKCEQNYLGMNIQCQLFVLVGLILPVLPETGVKKSTKVSSVQREIPLTHRLSACNDDLHDGKVKESPFAHKLKCPNFAPKGK